MTDREKVINELGKHIKSALAVDSDYVDCVRTDLLQTVVALLKEQEAVVRCKDCKHRPKEIPFTTSWGRHDTYLEFPEGSRCPGQCSDDSYYSWKPDDDWFCADGEKRTD